MAEIRLYSKEDIDQLQWPETNEGRKLRDLMLPLFKEGVKPYIDNVTTELFILDCNGHLLPLTVNEEEYENAYVASNYYALQFVKGGQGVLSSLLLPFHRLVVFLAKKMLHAIRINRMVMVNNLLLTSSLYPLLKEEEVEALTLFLQKRFPQHLIIFRHVDLFRSENLTRCLEKSDFKLFKTRFILGFNPREMEKLSSKVHYHHRRDIRLIEKEGYQIVRGDEFTPADIKRALELYEKVYVHKHTSYSPRYTKSFLENVMKKKIFEMVALKKEGRIDAVTGYFIYNETMINPFFGYETDLPFSSGLYRMMSTLIIEEAKRHQVYLNDSSGGEKTKLYRGLKPYLEYTAMCDCHLPYSRRLFWSVAQKVTNSLLFPKVSKRQLENE